MIDRRGFLGRMVRGAVGVGLVGIELLARRAPVAALAAPAADPVTQVAVDLAKFGSSDFTTVQAALVDALTGEVKALSNLGVIQGPEFLLGSGLEGPKLRCEIGGHMEVEVPETGTYDIQIRDLAGQPLLNFNERKRLSAGGSVELRGFDITDSC